MFVSKQYSTVVFPLMRALITYLILKFRVAALKKGRRLFESKINFSYEILKLFNLYFPSNNK